MAVCPHCESSNYRIQEPGLFENSYYCINCHRSFEKLSPHGKAGIFSVVVSVAIGIYHGLVGTDKPDNFY